MIHRLLSIVPATVLRRPSELGVDIAVMAATATQGSTLGSPGAGRAR